MEETEQGTASSSYIRYMKLLFIAAAIVAGLWFISQTIGILLLFFFAVVITLVLNAPTVWLKSKGLPRTAAALLSFFAMLLFLGLIGWLVLPRIMEQLSSLASNLPTYYQNLQNKAANWLTEYPTLQEKLLASSGSGFQMSSATQLLKNVGAFTFSLVSGIFLFIAFLSVIAYMLINPAPLLESYLVLFSTRLRPKATNALAHTSTMMVGWVWSNLVVGSMEAVAIYFFLSYMEVPGVWVWTGLAVFAELVPKLGLILMAVPPTLIALSIDPMTALWVALFYILLSEVMGDFVMPRVRASTMNLHPISSIFMMLAMASAFGLAGALIATPLAAFIKAYFIEFYLKSASKAELHSQTQAVLKRTVED